VDAFRHQAVLGCQSQMQAYFTRTAASHHHVPLVYFDIEEGFEAKAILN